MRKISIPPIKNYKTTDGTVVDVEAILTASFEDIGEAASQIPPYLGYFSHQKGLMRQMWVNGEHRVKEAEAKAYFALKNGEFISKGYGEKMTEAAVEHAVALDPAVIKAVEDLAIARKNYEWIQGQIEALQAKLDLVRSSETTRRLEHEPERKGTTV
jgi:phosphoglycolate phosphatase-like HAD superfamily hydrolase